MIKALAVSLLSGMFLLPAVSRAEAPPKREDSSWELALRSKYSVSSDQLTTEKAWILDSQELNPHRQRWILNRKLELVDLQPREISGAKAGASYGVTAGGLEAVTTAYFRGEGPWYRPMTDFPCEDEPVSWFGTLKGSQQAADIAAKEWDALLEQQRLKLSILLRRVTGISPGVALEKARILYDEWLKALELVWRTEGRVNSKKAEWKTYFAEARELGICGGKKTAKKSKDPKYPRYEDEYVPPPQKGPIPWELMMEPPGIGERGRVGERVDETKILARAPARLWQGLFSIRLNVTVAGRKLNGNFLIDTGSGTSVLSPEFLGNQGILAAWILAPGVPVRRVPWGGSGSSGSEGGLAPVVSVDLAEMGNTRVNIKDFALFNTEFFSPPENPASCCDGVLGTDFLRHYVVELHPGPPAEVKLWPPENFHIGSLADEEAGAAVPPSPWLETALGPRGDPISVCTTRFQPPRTGKSARFVGVRWDTGRQDALEVHTPWQKEARAAMGASKNSWELLCGPPPSEAIARDVPASLPKPGRSSESAALQAPVPAVTVGMELLSRGRVFLDFPHGRIWFPDKVGAEPIRRNHSGLALEFEFVGGKVESRALVVKAIKAGTPAEALIQKGLKPGMLITQVDKIDISELDARQVSRRLAGDFGEQVYVQWKSPQGLKLGLIKGIR